jgi:hypothetical protein
LSLTELDQALGRLEGTAPEYAGGLSNHGPMVAEALRSLGHEALISAWIDIYVPRLEDRSEGRPIPVQEQQSGLGRATSADWRATFEGELAAGGWPEVVRAWLPVLLPGYFAAAMHGPIRVAHSIRALEEEENPLRLGELAEALAYWASCFQGLPGEVGSAPQQGFGPAPLLAKVVAVPASRRKKGFLTEAVGVLDEEKGFAETMSAADLACAPPEELIGEICSCAAGLYLDNPSSRIAYIHALTGPAALRLMIPYLDATNLRRGIGYALQAAAALHCTHSEPVGQVAPASGEPEEAASWDELRYRAACSLEEHVIKLSEACWRENRIRPDERFRWAAADAVANLGTSWSGRGG